MISIPDACAFDSYSINPIITYFLYVVSTGGVTPSEVITMLTCAIASEEMFDFFLHELNKVKDVIVCALLALLNVYLYAYLDFLEFLFFGKIIDLDGSFS